MIRFRLLRLGPPRVPTVRRSTCSTWLRVADDLLPSTRVGLRVSTVRWVTLCLRGRLARLGMASPMVYFRPLRLNLLRVAAIQRSTRRSGVDSPGLAASSAGLRSSAVARSARVDRPMDDSPPERSTRAAWAPSTGRHSALLSRVSTVRRLCWPLAGTTRERLRSSARVDHPASRNKPLAQSLSAPVARPIGESSVCVVDSPEIGCWPGERADHLDRPPTGDGIARGGPTTRRSTRARLAVAVRESTFSGSGNMSAGSCVAISIPARASCPRPDHPRGRLTRDRRPLDEPSPNPTCEPAIRSSPRLVAA